MAANESKTDMVMKFVQKGGKRVNAECVLTKDPKDPFMKDFTPAGYDDYSDFFEVSKFEFGMEVNDEDKSAGDLSKHGQGSSGTGTGTSTGTQGSGAKPNGSGSPAGVQGNFASFRSARTQDLKNLDFLAKPDTFSFTRFIDAASPVFFDACTKTLTFDSAVLVKRVSLGSVGGGGSLLDININIGPLSLSTSASGGLSRPPQGYLRIDFQKVLITGINWDDGDLVSESCKFICQNFKVQYRQQNQDGTLQQPVAPAQWDYKESARRKLNGG